MTNKLFKKLFQDALEQPCLQQYIAEYGYPVWFDDINQDVDEIVKILTDIHYVANCSMRQLVNDSSMTQAAFAERFCIPLRTLEDWVAGRRTPPPYVKLMMAELVGVIERGSENAAE